MTPAAAVDPRTSDTDAWVAVLDALDERVRYQEAVVRNGAPSLPDLDFVPPRGPMPPELRLRAEVLLARCRLLEAEAADHLARRPAHLR